MCSDLKEIIKKNTPMSKHGVIEIAKIKPMFKPESRRSQMGEVNATSIEIMVTWNK